MKIRLLLAVVGLATSFALPTFAQQKDTADPQIAQQIRAAAKKYDEAFSKNDAPAMAALFTDDAVQVAPDGVYYGREAIEKRYAEMAFQQWHCNNHLVRVDQLIAVGNDVCWIGEWTCDCDGNQVKGYLSSVAVRDGDAWKIRISTLSVIPAPAPPAEAK